MLQVGDKYYKILEDNSLDILRVIQSDERGIKITRDGISKKRIEKEYLDTYTKINPDGYIFFNVVNMGNTIEEGQDVIVMLFRKKDLDDGNNTPFAAARQNIYDMFSSSTYNGDKTLLGVSLNIDGTPEGVNYHDILACQSVEYVEKISVYLDDRIYDYINMIKDISKYDRVLYKLYDALKDDKFDGMNTSLPSLLANTHFQYDFNRAFNIDEIEEILLYDNDKNILLRDSVMILEDFYKIQIENTYVLPFSKEIDLNKIKRKYVIVRDGAMGLYVIAYDEGGYINRPYNKLEDKSEVIELLRSIKK